jgi:dTDP-4-amino-4,6-dideoxygalactose transaminase
MSEHRIPLAVPFLTGNEKAYLLECLDTNFVSSVGPFVRRFEEEFAKQVGSRFAVACASGTAALHVAMRLVGVEPGDEVFVSSLTFIASANPIVYERGVPVFVDSEAESWNMDPGLVAEELDRRARLGLRQPRALEVVHLLGQPARMEELVDACARHGVALIEDASEALGATYETGRFEGKQVGAIGLLGCFSFNGNKLLTCGGGGMITTNDPELARRAKHLTTQARLPGLEYRHDEVGYNYRLTNLAAALGLAQLEKIDDLLSRKRANAEYYDARLRNLEGVSLRPETPWARASHWLHSILVDPDRFGRTSRQTIDALQADNIEARPIWSPLHTQAIFEGAPMLGSGRVSSDLFAKALSLPSSCGLTNPERARVVKALERARIAAGPKVSAGAPR